MILAALLLLAAASDEVPFEPSGERFADAAACRAHLSAEVAAGRTGGYDAVQGPYEVARGDVRMHTVRADGAGHRIEERRCLGDKLSARSWRHSMGPDAPEFTIESVASSAPWLKKGPAQQ